MGAVWVEADETEAASKRQPTLPPVPTLPGVSPRAATHFHRVTETTERVSEFLFLFFKYILRFY